MQVEIQCRHADGKLTYEQDGTQALLLADMHVLPGMEGGPVVDSMGNLVGVLGTPLSSHTFRAEVRQDVCLAAVCQEICAISFFMKPYV